MIRPSSFANVRQKWASEVKRHYKGAPILLVGSQIDLREDEKTRESLAKSKQRPISEEQGRSLAREIGAVTYAECSAMTQKGLKDVFDEAIIAVVNRAGQVGADKESSLRTCCKAM
ncbi:Cdc42 -like protein [Caligus rogercresseyi]|uniref:Cdc42 -like protein n=1 Tax=Caligus rogercresseyi TaxID=217165 RepID=A0A7T8GWV5_CALRO|nr:Cdc42 -like protein [Caligus rogercresseyi]